MSTGRPEATLDPATPPALGGMRRPVPALLRYYLLLSVAAGPGIVIVLPLRYFRYRTLQYEFDAEGVTMRWGILFRREISLTYARIQDIHLVSNVVERWLGLGRVEIQTASGQSSAEMTIEGLPDFERVRDELYQRMRGAKGLTRPGLSAASARHTGVVERGSDAAAALHDAVEELRAIREILSRRQP
jgi:membrane protein YdbS with pleckstrin-like domain